MRTTSTLTAWLARGGGAGAGVAQAETSRLAANSRRQALVIVSPRLPRLDRLVGDAPVVTGVAVQVGASPLGDDLAHPAPVQGYPVARLGGIGEATAVDLPHHALRSRGAKHQLALAYQQRLAVDEHLACVDLDDCAPTHTAMVERLQC